jgi:hypothetical protein
MFSDSQSLLETTIVLNLSNSGLLGLEVFWLSDVQEDELPAHRSLNSLSRVVKASSAVN